MNFAGGPEILVIAVVVLVLFGGAAIPKFARSIGKAQSEFKKGLGEGANETSEAKTEPSKSDAAS